PMWRRTVFDKIGLFDPTFTAPGDYEFLLRFAQAGLRAVHVPEVLSLFYQNAEGLSFKSKQRSQAEFDRIQSHYRANMPVERLFKIDPKDSSSVADGWIALGNMALNFEVPWFDNASQDLDYAITCYERALQCNPSNHIARHNLGVALALHGKHDQAQKWIRELPTDLRMRFEAASETGFHQPIQVPLGAPASSPAHPYSRHDL